MCKCQRNRSKIILICFVQPSHDIIYCICNLAYQKLRVFHKNWIIFVWMLATTFQYHTDKKYISICIAQHFDYLSSMQSIQMITNFTYFHLAERGLSVCNAFETTWNGPLIKMRKYYFKWRRKKQNAKPVTHLNYIMWIFRLFLCLLHAKILRSRESDVDAASVYYTLFLMRRWPAGSEHFL